MASTFTPCLPVQVTEGETDRFGRKEEGETEGEEGEGVGGRRGCGENTRSHS